MARIGLVVALSYEIELFSKACDLKENKEDGLFYGTYAGHTVIMTVCGVGKVNAAICTAHLIAVGKPDYILNSGFGGAVSKNLHPLDVAFADSLTYHDFHPLSLLENYAPGTSVFRTDEKLLASAVRAAEKLRKETPFNVEVGRIVSGDLFVESGEVKDRLSKEFGAICTEMEGAAVAHTALLSKVPFLVIRAISDNADEAAEMTFEEMIPPAAARLCAIVEGVLEDIPV